MIQIRLRCVPPSVTAQQKRHNRATGAYFHDARMKREEWTWAALLRPHVPPAPLLGPIALSVRLVYPHLKSAPVRTLGMVIPKVSKPDADNAAKHVIDLLASMRFISDDVQVASLLVEKYHGPEAHVGIYLEIAPMPIFLEMAWI